MLLIQNILTPSKARGLRNLRIHGVRIEGRTIYIRLGNISIRPWEVRKVDLDKSDYRIASLLKVGAIAIVNEPHIVVHSTPSPPPKPEVSNAAEPTISTNEVEKQDLETVLQEKSMAELRKILKNLGGKSQRTDKKDDLVSKILDLVG